MTTIRDIAKLSGFSISTVSRVINDSGYASAATKQKIKQIIHELDYVPNATARQLSHGKTNKIGVILPHIRDPYFSLILNGIIDAAFLTNYSVVLLPSKYEKTKERHYLELLKRKEVDGLIVTSHGLSLDELADYQQYGPIVVCENPLHTVISAVFSDRESAYVDALIWLKKQKLTDITLLLSRHETVSATAATLLQSYEKVFHKHPPQNAIIEGITTAQDGYQAAQKLIDSNQTVHAIFANTDDVAGGVAQNYRDHHLNVPQLIGQEKRISSVLLAIPTIDHHFYELGTCALKLVLSVGDTPKQKKMSSEFIVNNQFKFG